MNRPQILPNLVAAGMLLYGLSEHPYGYYTLLRWVVMIAAGVTAAVAFSSTTPLWGWLFVGLAVLFNPFAIVGLSRDTWQTIDIAAAVALAAGCVLRSRSVEAKDG